MYAIVNSLDTTAVRAIIKTTLLTAIIVIVFVLTYYAVTTVTPFVVAALAAVLTAVAHAVAIVAAGGNYAGGQTAICPVCHEETSDFDICPTDCTCDDCAQSLRDGGYVLVGDEGD